MWCFCVCVVCACVRTDQPKPARRRRGNSRSRQTGTANWLREKSMRERREGKGQGGPSASARVRSFIGVWLHWVWASLGLGSCVPNYRIKRGSESGALHSPSSSPASRIPYRGARPLVFFCWETGGPTGACGTARKLYYFLFTCTYFLALCS